MSNDALPFTNMRLMTKEEHDGETRLIAEAPNENTAKMSEAKDVNPNQSPPGGEPIELVEEICHEEQMTVWTGEIAGALSLGNFVRDDLSYDDVIELHATIGQEIKRVITSALDHPAAYASLTDRVKELTTANAILHEAVANEVAERGRYRDENEVLRSENERLKSLYTAGTWEIVESEQAWKKRALASEARNQQITKALEEITAACEADFCGPMTEEGENRNLDEEGVAWVAKGECELTFGMIRRARTTLSHPDQSTEASHVEG